MSKIRVFAPATVANVGPCFDRAGFAVGEPGDFVTAELRDKPGVEIVEITGDSGKLPLDPEKNTAGVVASEVLFLADSKKGVRLWLEKGMPLFSGLGSSAASGAAAAVAVNELLGKPFSKEELLVACGKGEQVACGTDHLDNVAPSLLGGLTIIDGDQIMKYDFAFDFAVVLISPEFHLSTSKSRAALDDIRTEIEGDARKKIQRLAAADNFADFAKVVGENALLEKIRGELIPGFKNVKEAGLDAGAKSVTISGSGPSLFALVEREKAEAVERAMLVALEEAEPGLPALSWVTEVDLEGATVTQ
jgi:homoserine kinase